MRMRRVDSVRHEKAHKAQEAKVENVRQQILFVHSVLFRGNSRLAAGYSRAVSISA
jgi:hypothetical protein